LFSQVSPRAGESRLGKRRQRPSDKRVAEMKEDGIAVSAEDLSTAYVADELRRIEQYRGKRSLKPSTP